MLILTVLKQTYQVSVILCISPIFFICHCVFWFMCTCIYQYSHTRRWQQYEQVETVNEAATKCIVNTIMLLYASCSAHSYYFWFNYPHGIRWSTVCEASSVYNFIFSPITSSCTSRSFLSPSMQLMIKVMPFICTFCICKMLHSLGCL